MTRAERKQTLNIWPIIVCLLDVNVTNVNNF